MGLGMRTTDMQGKLQRECIVGCMLVVTKNTEYQLNYSLLVTNKVQF